MIQRWELTDVGSAFLPWREMRRDPYGEWVDYDDVAPMLAALSICAWAQVWGQDPRQIQIDATMLVHLNAMLLNMPYVFSSGETVR